MSPAVECLIGLGSNLGERAAYLNRACEMLAASAVVEELQVSRFLATQPIGGPPGQGEFLNGAAFLRTEVPAKDLFTLLKKVEQEVGRQHVQRWGPRVIDLDVLLHGDTVLCGDSPRDLIVPHPRMAFRRFVLEPAAEVAPDMRHPVIGWSIAELVDHLRNCPPCVAAFSDDASRAQQLVAEVAAVVGATVLSSEQTGALGISAWGADQIFCDGPMGQTTPARPKLSIVDGRNAPSQTGPSLDITNLSREQALAEVVAAIEAMRE